MERPRPAARAVRASRSPYRLSGGEQRRLSLAVALVRDPGVLVLDEPTFGQDRPAYEALLGILDEHLDDGATPDRGDPRPAASSPTSRDRGSLELDRRSDRRGRGRRLIVRPPRARATRSSTARSAGPARSSSSAIAFAWLIGLALTLAWPPPLVLAAAALVAGIALGARPRRATSPARSRRCGSPRSGSGSSTRCSRRQRRPGGATALAARAAPDHGRGASARRRRSALRVVAIAVGRRGVHADDRLDPAGRLARPAGPRLAAVRVRRARRVPGDPAVRRGPRDAPPGAPDPGSARLAGTRGCSSALLVLAIRHGDRMALAMDARAFGSGPLTALPRDPLVAAGPGVAVAARWRPSQGRCVLGRLG